MKWLLKAPGTAGLASLVAGNILAAEPWLKALDPETAGTNLLRNPQFEQLQGALFPGWQASRDGFLAAPGEGRNGSTALKCVATNTTQWRGVSQTLNLARTEPRPLVVRGWSRAANVSGSPDADYSLYVDIVYADGTPLWGQIARFETGTADWQRSQVLILPEKPVRSLSLYCMLRNHTGTAWFDDVEVREIVAPNGGVVFQGAPMQVLTVPSATGSNVLHRTGDGLSLAMAGSRVAALRLGEANLAGPAFGGFFARDVAAGSDVYGFTDGECPELGLHLDYHVEPGAGHLAFSGQLRSTRPGDRAILFGFALPLAEGEWSWGEDIRTARPLTGRGEFASANAVGAGTTGTMSAYPVGTVTGRDAALTLGLHPSSPALYRVTAHAGTRQLLLIYDFGLAPEPQAFPSAAPFGFVLYHSASRDAFRGAWAKYMQVFPAAFEVRSRSQGIWMPFTDVSTVQGWADFGFRYHEGNNNVPWDDAHGVLSFRYTEPMTWWMPMAPELPRTEAEALRVRDEYAAGPAGSQQRMALVSRTAAMLSAKGGPALLFRNEPWANGAVWSLNPNPALPGDLNAATVHWNPSIKSQLYGSNAPGQLDGEYLDSLEGYVTADLNYDRSHFASTTVPLTFATDSFRPVLFKGLAVAEFTRWISQDLHSMGKLCFANGVPYRFGGLLAPWLDILGTETDWLPGGQYRPSSFAQMDLWRTLSGAKPYLLLMNTRFDEFDTTNVERYFQRSLFYGMYPSMFSHNASEDPYWRNPAWYNRDRALFKKYIPVIRRVAEAGWQALPAGQVTHSGMLLERFGPDPDGSVYHTVFNNTASEVSAELRSDEVPPSASARRAAVDLLSGEKLAWTGTGWKLTLPSQSATAIQVLPPGRFSAIQRESVGRIRLSFEASVGSEQVIEASADLRQWEALHTNKMSTSPVTWLDDSASDASRYYRLRW